MSIVKVVKITTITTHGWHYVRHSLGKFIDTSLGWWWRKHDTHFPTSFCVSIQTTSMQPVQLKAFSSIMIYTSRRFTTTYLPIDMWSDHDHKWPWHWNSSNMSHLFLFLLPPSKLSIPPPLHPQVYPLLQWACGDDHHNIRKLHQLYTVVII